MKALVFLAALLVAGAAYAVPIDWEKYATLDTVEVMTIDESGGQRLTTVWIVVLDHQAYLRTAGTTWGDNVERNGTLTLRALGIELPVRAEKVLSESEADRVVAAFREKYGRTDAVMEWLRFGERRVFRLLE